MVLLVFSSLVVSMALVSPSWYMKLPALYRIYTNNGPFTFTFPFSSSSSFYSERWAYFSHCALHCKEHKRSIENGHSTRTTLINLCYSRTFGTSSCWLDHQFQKQWCPFLARCPGILGSLFTLYSNLSRESVFQSKITGNNIAGWWTLISTLCWTGRLSLCSFFKPSC